MGTTVALAPLPHAWCWCQGRNPLDACTFTDLSPPTPPGFLRVEDTLPKSLGSEVLVGWGSSYQTGQKGSLCMHRAPPSNPFPCMLSRADEDVCCCGDMGPGR